MGARVPRVAERRPGDRWNVILWRQEALERAGCPPVVALDIAERVDIDLHKACAMFRAGCDPRLAREILL